MSDKRFFYNPDSKALIDCDNSSHALYYQNNKLKASFDDYIRGIVSKNTVYIRVFYPYDDIYNPLPYNELIKKSGQLIRLYLKDIEREVKKFYRLKNVKIIINATNDTLKTNLKTNYV